MRITSPRSCTGCSMSNSAANEWCAAAGPAASTATSGASAEAANTLSDIYRTSRWTIVPVTPALPAVGSRRGLLRHQLTVQQLLGELDTVELEQPRVFLHAAVQRQADRPRLREGLRIVDRRL